MIAGHEFLYLNTIEALNYLAEYIRPDIIVVVKLLRVQFPNGYKIFYGIFSDMSKAQNVLINSIMKIKMGPWCDIR
jgi:hypothetical protein